MQTLGIIGGIAPASTIEYYRMVVAAYQTRQPDGSTPPVIINSIDLKTLLALAAADALDELAAYLAAEVAKLARAGAGLALFASNTPHLVFDAVRRQSPIPMLSIVECAADAAVDRGLRRVGLLGTRFTMDATFYPETFSHRGITLVVPDDADSAYVHEKYMGELVRGEYRDETRAGVLAVIDRVRALYGVDGIILGGTELPLLLGEASAVAIPLLDTGRIHVEAAVAAMLA